ncbi:MAG: hypothetical protein FJX84_00605 [Bacteroidetes bacterium]|nr:hypothetical protein [Bacteroidota bacterium]
MPKTIFLFFLLCLSFATFSQDYTNGGTFTGNIESTFQYLNNDSIIAANQPAQKGLINSYMNVFYTNKNFKAGMRIESYLPRIQGYPNRFDGTGIGMRYIGYTNKLVDITLGSFYEQFGAGLSLRAYEDRALGYDNLLDGIRLIVNPYSGVRLKGVYGYQRLSFQQGRIIHGEGIVRGVDAEINFKEAFDSLLSDDWDFGLGASFVSKFQADNDNELILPQNVGAYGGRFNARYKKINLNGEYILKEQDPSNDNSKIYNFGHAAIFNLSYSKKGFGVLLSGKSVDNMSYRSDRTKDLQDVFINFLPALNKTHTYNLVATLYPYATQPLGEVAYQAEVLYSFKKGTLVGGKYGTTVNFNFSTTYRPTQRTSGINPLDSTGVTYRTRPFEMSDSLYWRDININVTKKFNKKLSFIFSYFNINVNNDVAKISNDASGIIKAHIGVVEGSYKINKKHAIRAELQGLLVERKNGQTNDKGDWATILVEYTVSPHWSFGFMNQYNYGHPNPNLRVHYPIITFGYVKEATRFMIYYGRQRAGLFCVGGVCRFVPASNGLTLSFTQSF